MLIKPLLPTVLLAFLLSACQTTSSKHYPTQPTNNTEQQLANLIADPSCDATYQCRVISYGKNECGKQSKFAIYSTKHVAPRDIEQLTNTLTAIQAEGKHGIAREPNHNCTFTPKPQTLCIANVCQPIYVND